jgi:hypothetical protein
MGRTRTTLTFCTGAGQKVPFAEYCFAPRGLRRQEAAWYVGVSPSKFDDWVARRLMPPPKKQDGVVVWDRRSLDAAFDALPDSSREDKDNPFRDLAL